MLQQFSSNSNLFDEKYEQFIQAVRKVLMNLFSNQNFIIFFCLKFNFEGLQKSVLSLVQAITNNTVQMKMN